MPLSQDHQASLAMRVVNDLAEGGFIASIDVNPAMEAALQSVTDFCEIID